MQWYGRWEKGENSTFVGPGHPSVVGDWLVYHAWLYDHIAADQVTQLIINLFKYEERHLKKQEVPGRQLLIDQLLWTETKSTNGSAIQLPRVAGGRPSDTEQPGPEANPTIMIL